MNIIFLSPQIYPHFVGGAEIFNYHLINNLRLKGYNVNIVSRWELNCVNIDKNNDLLTKIMLRPLLSLIKCLISRNIILHISYTSNSRLALPVLLYNIILKVPYIVTIHGGGLHPWKHKTLHKFFFERAASIIAVSNPIKNEYEMRCKRPIKVIPPIIPFKLSKLEINKIRNKYNYSTNDIIIFSVGSLKSIKRSNILLDAFLNLGLRYVKEKNLKLLFVGDGPLKEGLEKKARLSQQLFNHIKFIGSIENEYIPDIYKMSNIYVISSKYEGTSISLLEAMFNTKPIIGSNVSGIKDIILNGINGLLFNEGDINELTQLIKLTIENQYGANRMARKAHEDFIKSFNFEICINEYINIYNIYDHER